MNILIDTHALLWWLSDNPKLGTKARHQIATCETAYVSIASLWEIVIKKGIGKLEADLHSIFDAIQKNGFANLSIEPRHLLSLDQLPDYHRDPFDRIIISQAQSDNLRILTVDSAFEKYDVEIFQATN